MAQFPAYPPPPIIGPEYCAPGPDPVYLAISRKLMKITDGNFNVKDIYGNIRFNVKEFLMTFHSHRVMFDAAGTPLVTLRKKIRSVHERWQVFRGESKDLRDLIFTAKKSSMLQHNSNLDVFLANNREEKVCDFKVKGKWSKKSCVVYAGESDIIVAEISKTSTVKYFVFETDEFQVTVHPYIDHAFIISLIMILDAIDPLPPGVSTTTQFVSTVNTATQLVSTATQLVGTVNTATQLVSTATQLVGTVNTATQLVDTTTQLVSTATQLVTGIDAICEYYDANCENYDANSLA